jgi:hypothetical protein
MIAASEAKRKEQIKQRFTTTTELFLNKRRRIYK